MSQEPIEELAAEIRKLERSIDSLQSDVRLTRLRDKAEDLGTTASGLVERVKESRARGYPFERTLEDKAKDLEQQWVIMRRRVFERIERESESLERELPSVERQVRQVAARANDPTAAQPFLERAERAVEALERKVESAQDSVEGMYDTLKEKVQELVQHLERVEWMLVQLAEATFQLLPTEAGIMAVKAKWDKEGKDDPEGVLFLTDQRLIFEQKQEVATKKVLFITTKKEKVQQLLLEVPVGQIEKAQASRKGLLKHQDHIDVTFARRAPVSAAHFHLEGQNCKTWQALIGQAKAGDFDRDRAIELDQEVVEKVKSAPTRCPKCNAPITQRVLRGMDTIACEYCGHVIRL